MEFCRRDPTRKERVREGKRKRAEALILNPESGRMAAPTAIVIFVLNAYIHHRTEHIFSGRDIITYKGVILRNH